MFTELACNLGCKIREYLRTQLDANPLNVLFSNSATRNFEDSYQDRFHETAGLVTSYLFVTVFKYTYGII